jgi:hypothetical protein
VPSAVAQGQHINRLIQQSVSHHIVDIAGPVKGIAVPAHEEEALLPPEQRAGAGVKHAPPRVPAGSQLAGEVGPLVSLQVQEPRGVVHRDHLGRHHVPVGSDEATAMQHNRASVAVLAQDRRGKEVAGLRIQPGIDLLVLGEVRRDVPHVTEYAAAACAAE